MAPSSTSTTPLHILFLGATGYIGGSVLGRLLQHPARDSWNIVSYSRNQEKAKLLTQQFGVRSIIGTLDESQKIEDAAAEADVVIHTAESADHIGSARAILRGLKRKFEQSGKPPIYIHTSGTGVLIDDAKGKHGDHIIYDDTDVAQLKSIPENAIHRNVDLEVLAADEEGYVRAYLVFPSVIFGLATGPIFDAKLANPHSILVPMYVKTAIDRGQPGMVGDGKNVWPVVHIRDTAELFAVLLDNILKNPDVAGHGWNGFYFADNGHFTYVDLAREIGSALAKLGKVSKASPTTYTKEDLGKYFGGSDILGSNSRCVSKRARALGWTPQYTVDDFFTSIAPEIDAILASGQLAVDTKLTETIALQAAKEEQAKP